MEASWALWVPEKSTKEVLTIHAYHLPLKGRFKEKKNVATEMTYNPSSTQKHKVRIELSSTVRTEGV